jgi:hypothetical protein
MGLNISAGLNSVVTIYILVPLILVPQLLFSGVVVEFDKMHNKIASDKNVPFIGDMITSRWAYEALMVTQFKDNRFERNFYQIEKDLKSATYFRSYAIPELKSITAECLYLANERKSTYKRWQDLQILKKEIEKISNSLNLPVPAFVSSINVAPFDSTLYVKITSFLHQTEKQYILLHAEAMVLRDAKYEQLVKKTGGPDAFLRFKQQYHNKQVSSIVTNDKEFKEYEKQNEELLPLKNAIFRDPATNYGRAHFYAPFKKLGLISIDTFWFNLGVIWIYSIVLFVFLYFDILRKIIAYFETLRLNRANRRRFLRLLNVNEGILMPRIEK